MQARRWLMLLRHDEVSSIRIVPDISLPMSVLGFTFSSNHNGLRGPSDEYAETIILGTSFAMGFGVDDGCNWYDAFPSKGYFNASIPVGPRQWNSILNSCFKGKRTTALFIYHPNIWQHAINYEKLHVSKKTAFEYFNWKTGLLECALLQRRKLKEWHEKTLQGSRIKYK